MSDRPMVRPPLLGRALMRAIAGPDAEVVRGDLEESFHTRVARRGDSLRTRLAFVADVGVTLGYWWIGGRRSATVTASRSTSRGGGGMRGIGTEVSQTWRALVRRPGYAAVVILTLGLGIGVTTTIFSVVDTMLIRALPYRDAERLVAIGNTVQVEERADGQEGLQQLEPMSYLNLEDVRARVNGFEEVAALERSQWMVEDQGSGPEMLQVANVTTGFFELLDVQPYLGRIPGLEDYGGGRGRGSWGALISYEAWQSRFGGDPAIVGKTATLGATFTIVGVLPRDFYQPAALVGGDVDFWMHLDPADRRYQDRLRRNLQVVGRLEPGVTVGAARAELAAAQVQLVRDQPAANVARDGSLLGIGVNSLRDETIGSAARPMLIFLGAAVLLLVLACSNAANLLLVRGLERGPDLALRRAIGASRVRLVANLLVESLSLALAAGAVGVAIAFAGVSVFRRVGPESLPRLTEVGVNPRVVLAGALLSLVVGVAIGIMPALRSSGADVLANLRSSRHTASFRGARFRTALAATQLALAVVLGVAASLLFRSFVEVRTQELGFKPAGLVAFVLPFKKDRPWEVWDLGMQVMRAVPGTRSVAIATNLPFQTPVWSPRVERVDRPGAASSAGVPGYAVTPNFFETAGIPIVQGRAFDASDRPDSRAVAVVNRAFVRAFLADRDPIGARLRILSDWDPNQPHQELEVVGVAGDVVQARVEDGVDPALYVPYTQSIVGLAQVLLATDRDAESIAPDIRRAAGTVVPFPVLELSSMESRISATQTSSRFQLFLIGSFAIAAVLLSAIGLYGTLAFTVRARFKELGIRMAIGADRPSIFGLVVKQGMFVLAVGLLTGLGVALGVTRVLQSFLFHVEPIDPLAFLIGIATISFAALLAVLRPAARAARIDPLSSIRTEG